MPAQYSYPRSSDRPSMSEIPVRKVVISSAVSAVTLLRYRRTARLVLLSGWPLAAAASGTLLDTVTYRRYAASRSWQRFRASSGRPECTQAECRRPVVESAHAGDSRGPG